MRCMTWLCIHCDEVKMECQLDEIAIDNEGNCMEYLNIPVDNEFLRNAKNTVLETLKVDLKNADEEWELAQNQSDEANDRLLETERHIRSLRELLSAAEEQRRELTHDYCVAEKKLNTLRKNV